MGYDIPIYYFSVDPIKIGPNDISIEQVRNIIVDKYRNAEESGLYETNSHSWWHQNIILELCTDMGITGLEFLEEEIAYLDGEKLAAANIALTLLINHIRNGIPKTNKPDEYACVEILRNEDFSKAFMEATPSYKVEFWAKNDFEEAVSFYSFIKSLQRAIEETLAKKQHLLYYRPGP